MFRVLGRVVKSDGCGLTWLEDGFRRTIRETKSALP